MARLFGEWQRDFSGGWVDSVAPNKYARNQVARIINGRIRPDGSVRRRGGIARYSANDPRNSGARGYGILPYTWQTLTGPARRMLLIFGDTAYIFSGTGFSAETATLPIGYWDHTLFVQGGAAWIVFANGGTTYKKEAGVAGISAATGYPSGVKYLATFNDRVWYTGHNDIELVGTKIGDFEDHGIDAINLQIQTHDGDPDMRGLQVYRDHLLVFKRRSLSIVDGYGDTDIIVATGPRGLAESVGCIAPRTIASAGDLGVLWLSDRGLEMYQDGQIRLLSQLNRGFFANDIAWDTIGSDPELPCAAYDPATQLYHLAVPGVGDSENTRSYVWSIQHGAASLDHIDASVNTYRTAIASAPMPNERSVLAAQSSTGYIHRVDSADPDDSDDEPTTSANGKAIPLQVRTRPLIYADEGFERHRARLIEILAEADLPSALTIKTIADGDETDSQDRTLAASSEGGVSEARTRTNGRGRTIQAEVQTTDDVTVAGIRVAAEVLKDPV